MNTRIISDAIAKIANINPGLNEESLNNLLIASGWERVDIEQGISQFKQLTIAKEAVNTEEAFVHTRNNTGNENANVQPTEVVNTKIVDLSDIVKATPEEILVEKGISNAMVYVNVILLIVLLAILAIYIIRFRLV